MSFAWRNHLPKILPEDVTARYIVFHGKQDLEKQLVRRLRFWRIPNTQFVVMRDQDSADCKVVKAKLVELCIQAGRPDALIRVACHELESFYLGDLAAVEAGLQLTGLARRQLSSKFRDPDHLTNPAQEKGCCMEFRIAEHLLSKPQTRFLATAIFKPNNTNKTYDSLLLCYVDYHDKACSTRNLKLEFFPVAFHFVS